MTGKTKKIILITIAILVIAAVSIGYYMYNRGPVNVNNSSGLPINAGALYTAYTADSVAARKKYDEKILEVTGQISEIKQNTQDQQVILLKTSSEGGYINCTMEVPASNLKVSDHVIIKGICSGIGQGDPDLGILGDVYLTRSIISK
jgi:hypothetical protein